MSQFHSEIRADERKCVSVCSKSSDNSWGQQLHCPLGSFGQWAVCSGQFNLHCTALPRDFSGQVVWAVQFWAVLGSSWAVF